MQSDSLKALVAVASLFFFTTNLSSSFLPIYFENVGLNVEIFLFAFIVLGFLPIVLLKFVKNFERIVIIGIFTTLLFFVVLILEIKTPVILGLVYGTSLATFWPSFNLLQFRLSESKGRARTISLLSFIIPSLTGIVGPAAGGFIIESLGYGFLFGVSIVLYLIAFAFSTRLRFEPESHKFSIPKSRMFAIFFVSFLITGFIDVYWIAYPFLIFKVSETMSKMGLVLAATGIFVCIITFLVNWLSDIKRARIEFSVIGAVLSTIWYVAIGFAFSVDQIILLSLLGGFAYALRISWMALYGDSFGREHYASILVIYETGLMIGRVISLVPTYVYISQANYMMYFILMGAVSLPLIPLAVLSKKETK